MHAYTDTRMYYTTPKHKVYNSIYWCSRGAKVVKTVYKNLKTISSNETKQWKKDCVALTTEVDLVMSQVSNEDDKFLTTMRCYIKTPLDHVTHVRQTTSSFTVRLEPVPGWSGDEPSTQRKVILSRFWFTCKTFSSSYSSMHASIASGLKPLAVQRSITSTILTVLDPPSIITMSLMAV